MMRTADCLTRRCKVKYSRINAFCRRFSRGSGIQTGLTAAQLRPSEGPLSSGPANLVRLEAVDPCREPTHDLPPSIMGASMAPKVHETNYPEIS